MTSRKYWRRERTSEAELHEALAPVRNLLKEMHGKECEATIEGIRETFNIFGGSWAVACEGEKGLETLAKLAQNEEPVVWGAEALRVLATIASVGTPPHPGSDCPAHVWGLASRTIAENAELQRSAKDHLRELAVRMPEERLLELMACGLRPLVKSPPSTEREIMQVLSGRWFAIGESIVREYEAMVSDETNGEEEYHQWFEEHPQMLDPLAIEVASKPSLRGVKEPDFVIRRFDDTYIVVELKKPSTRVLNRDKSLSAPITKAIQQSQTYAMRLARWGEAEKAFPRIDHVDRLIIAGKQEELDEDARKVVRETEENNLRLRLVGFDWVATRARAMCRNLSATPAVSKRTQVA